MKTDILCTKNLKEKNHEKEENSSNTILHYAIELATITGMRANEVCALKWEDMFAMPNTDIKEIIGHKEIQSIKCYKM